MSRHFRFAIAALFALVSFAGSASAEYPTHTVKLVVGYPPGGTTDVLARLITKWLSEHLGQQFIVENKPGGGNNIATEFVANAAPDGYTMLLVNPANGINTTLYKNLSFNFVRDITGVA
ncbi:MAG TPA: tripartite tricarboxylate transporter substrate-binding protein, partial [Usitatibacter sp.]|nr:tripartite tricarboxylate transporter substrate-binding protein [Usitatibacter sp.]